MKLPVVDGCIDYNFRKALISVIQKLVIKQCVKYMYEKFMAWLMGSEHQ